MSILNEYCERIGAKFISHGLIYWQNQYIEIETHEGMDFGDFRDQVWKSVQADFKNASIAYIHKLEFRKYAKKELFSTFNSVYTMGERMSNFKKIILNRL